MASEVKEFLTQPNRWSTWGVGIWRGGRGWELEGTVAETMGRNGREEREGMGEVGMHGGRGRRGGERRGQKRSGQEGKAQTRRNCFKLALSHLNVL